MIRRTGKGRRLVITLILASAGSWATGCGAGDPGGDAVAAPPTSVSAAATTSSATTSSPTSTTSEPAPTTTTSTSAPSPSGPPELTPGDEGRRLTLSDFFNPSSYWTEDRYNIADQKNVSGIANTIQGCGSGSTQELELRLGNNFSRLTFSFGQANDSIDSDQNVSVEVVGNGSQMDIQSVPFNEIHDFDIPVTGVNALKIRLVLDDKVADCGGSVIGVIMDPVLS
ncbi:hypothetical protein ACI8AC_17935 [Geodermatophilus sp. SYSU D00758]